MPSIPDPWLRRPAWAALVFILWGDPSGADDVLTGIPADENMWFGKSVDINGEDVIAVGAPHKDDGKGAVFVFRRSGGSWDADPVLTEPFEMDDVALYGQTVAIREEVLAVGAATEDVVGMQDRGAVYVYRYLNAAWARRTKLISPGGASGDASGDAFGDSLALGADFLLAGAPRVNASEVDAGRAYLWRRATEDSWIYHQTLQPPSDGREDQFGDRVAISGDFVFVSAPWRDETALDSGVIYVFKKGANGIFAPHQTLLSPGGANYDRFGSDLAADGDLLVVGSPGIEGPVPFSGSAFVYRNDNGTWIQDGPPLGSPTAHAFDVFGQSVAIRGSKIVVGASGDNGQGSGAGAAFTFVRADQGWSFQGRPSASDDDPLRTLGDAVAIGNSVFAAGAYAAGDGGTVHVFPCAPDPVVFIPGIAGSVLTQGSTELWPSLRGSTICKLALPETGTPIEATDVVRNAAVIGPLGPNIYGEYLEHLADDREHVEYEIGGDRDLLFEAAHMQSLDPKPTLFPFPYDWRKSNSVSAAELHQYITAIRQLYPDRKVNIVAHSMGGLVIRRYLLDRGDGAIGRIATIGTPFWGASVAVYRMAVGEFFEIPGVDALANEEIRKTLRTLPGFFELLPTELYQQVTGEAVILEAGRDDNGNGRTDDQFGRTEFWRFLDARASTAQKPSAVSLAFHTLSQDDWSGDSLTVPYLHIVGRLRGAKTTTQVKLVERPSYDLAKLTRRYEKCKGAGDGTVPILSALRTASHRAPVSRTTVREICGGSEASHNGMMENAVVWDMLIQFLNALPVDEQIKPSPGQSPGVSDVVRILIVGTPWARIENQAGDWNEPVGDLGYRSVPGLEIAYGGADEWIEIVAPVNQSVLVNGSAVNGPLEIEVHTLDATRAALALERFRFLPGQNDWRLDVQNADSSSWLDEDGSGTFEPGEEIVASHSLIGPDVDVVPPSLTVLIRKIPAGVRLEYVATDDSGAATIRCRIDDGVAEDLVGPLSFPDNARAMVRCAAEDPAGNLSAFMETTVNPELGVGRDEAANVVILEWPLADGYLLEESTDLNSWQGSPQAILRDGDRRSVRLDLTDDGRFFRLRGSSLTR